MNSGYGARLAVLQGLPTGPAAPFTATNAGIIGNQQSRSTEARCKNQADSRVNGRYGNIYHPSCTCKLIVAPTGPRTAHAYSAATLGNHEHNLSAPANSRCAIAFRTTIRIAIKNGINSTKTIHRNANPRNHNET